MEIVTWVLTGSLVHQDSTGHAGVIYPGLAQRMSAGTGILHSEKNDSWRLHGGDAAHGPGALRPDVGRAGRGRHRARLRAAGDRRRTAPRRLGPGGVRVCRSMTAPPAIRIKNKYGTYAADLALLLLLGDVIFACWMAIAAAFRPIAAMYPDSSVMSVMFTLMRTSPIFCNSGSRDAWMLSRLSVAVDVLDFHRRDDLPELAEDDVAGLLLDVVCIQTEESDGRRSTSPGRSRWRR